MTVFRNITMSEFGGRGEIQPSAYGGMVNPNVPGVALPYRFSGNRPKVKITAGGKSITVPVVDVGPWFHDDPWFAHAGGRPRAERHRRNKAGIDATPAVWAALGMCGEGMAKVDIEIVK